tara:strand:- start:99 stop:1313 length:1215 start_codon:yes stop_codon:yes gene_type:complete
MPSSNDRKISQLPLLTELKEDTTFLVVSDVGTTPKNERMHAQTLFDQIPSTLTIGQELNGKDVTFNTTLDATNRLHFDSMTGNLSLGHDLHVANSVHIVQDLYCSGNVHFDSFTPNFANLELSGDFLCGNDAAVGNNLTVLQDTDLQADVYVRGDLHTANNLYVTELSSLDKIKNNYFEGLRINAVSLTIETIDSKEIDVDNLRTKTLFNEGAFTSNGYISIVGNITGDIGNFNGMNISQNISVGNVLSVPTITATSQITAPQINVTNLYSQDLLSPLGRIEQFSAITTTSNTVSAGFVSSTEVRSQNVETQFLSANSVDITHFSSENFDANVISANSVNTDITITDLVQAKVYTVRPSAANLSYGTMIVYNDSSDNLSLEILMPDASNNPEWKRIFLGNPVPA